MVIIMDIRPRASLMSRSYEYKIESRTESSNMPVSSNTVNRVGLNWIDKSVRAKRPKLSNEELTTDGAKLEEESTSDGSTNGNSNGIFQRVTSTVSGLFSNVSWSEWLRSSSAPTSVNESCEPTQDNAGPEELDDSSIYEEAKSENQSFNLLYPEEGVTNFSDSGEELRKCRNTEEENKNSSFLIHPEQPFKKNMSFVSSTPSLSPSTYKRRGNEDYLCESIISKPSTSNYKNEIITPREDSISLLKKTFPEPKPEPIYQASTSFSSSLSSRKRLRENIEDESIDNDSGPNGTEGRYMDSLNLLSEQTKGTNHSVGKKRPRFSISSYGSPLYKKREEQEEQEPSFSIFYPGKIMYGGASNHQRKRSRIIPRKIRPRIPTVSTNLEDDYSDGGLSSAARRILNCIDKISTPLSDSKRALPFTSMRDHMFSSSTFVADFHKNRPTLRATSEITTPPATKLLTPSKVKITKNFSSLFEPKDSNLTKDNSFKENSRTTRKSSSPVNVNKSFIPASTTSISTPSSSIQNSQSVLPSIVGTKSVPMKPFVSLLNNSKSLETKDKLPETKPSEPDNKSQNITLSKSICKPFNINKNDPVEKGVTKSTSSSSEEISFRFSEPMVLSDNTETESTSVNNTEFKFSLPIDEKSHSAQNQGNLQDFPGWDNRFMHQKDMWECECCLLQNEKSKLKCVACESPKPMTSSSDSKTSSSASTNLLGNWGDKFKVPEGSWNCESCLLQNEKEADKCVACLTSRAKEEIKEKENSKPTVQPFSSFFGGSKSANETKNPVETDVNKGNEYSSSWGDAFKPSQGSWECDVCLIQNNSADSKCIACQTAKPKSSSNSGILNSKGSFDFGEKVKQDKSIFPEGTQSNFTKSNEENWTCLVCEGSNRIGEEICSDCKSAKPVLNNSKSSSTCKTSFGGSFGMDFMKNNNDWECETCLVRNKPNLQKCACCETPRVQTKHSTLVSEAITGNFKFGVPKSSPKLESAPVVSLFNAQDKSCSTQVSFATPTQDSSKFIFGNPVSSSANVPQPIIPSTKPNTEQEQKPLFEVKPPTKEEPKSDIKSVFKFGSTLPPTTNNSEKKLEFPKIGSTSSSSEKSDLFSQPFPKVNPSSFNFFGGENKPSTASPFNQVSSKEPTTTPLSVPTTNTPNFTYVFGQQNTKSSASTGFNFGEANQNKPAAFTFGSTASTPMFQFGQEKSSATPLPSLQPKPDNADPPSFLNIELPKANPFNPAGPPNQHKRIIKRAVRKHK